MFLWQGYKKRKTDLSETNLPSFRFSQCMTSDSQLNNNRILLIINKVLNIQNINPKTKQKVQLQYINDTFL